MMIIDIFGYGETAYNAYARVTGGKTFDGRDMPAWEDLSSTIKAAWQAAASAAVHLWRHGSCECSESIPTGREDRWY
jgi:hypothetical protein